MNTVTLDDENLAVNALIRQLIRKTLGKYGVPKTIISNTRGGYSIDTSLLRCDYFDYLEGKPVVTARLRQYMEQYSWAETVKSNLFN